MNCIRKYTSNYVSLLKLALPIIIGQLGGIITGLADTIMVGQHSTQELAAASFVNNVLNAFIIFGTGFSFALTPLIGENLARNKKYVVAAWQKNSIVANLMLSIVLTSVLLLIYFNIGYLGLVVSFLTCLALYLLRNDISCVFSDDPVVAKIVVMLLPILMLYQFVDGAQIVLANSLRGLSDVKSIMWISFVTNFLIAIPAGYILGFPMGMGVEGIWLAYPIGFVFSVALLAIRARKLMNR